jgi:hypothetical protein
VEKKRKNSVRGGDSFPSAHVTWELYHQLSMLDCEAAFISYIRRGFYDPVSLTGSFDHQQHNFRAPTRGLACHVALIEPVPRVYSAIDEHYMFSQIVHGFNERCEI